MWRRGEGKMSLFTQFGTFFNVSWEVMKVIIDVTVEETFNKDFQPLNEQCMGWDTLQTVSVSC